METEEITYEEYFSDQIFDFSDFLDQKINTDCILILSDEKHTKLLCHKLILSNTSKFFDSAFTIGLDEEKTAQVEITCNPLNLFPEVLRYLYTSVININDYNIMAIYEISHVYEIQILEDNIKEIVSSVDPSKLMLYTKSCYDNELTKALEMLIPFLAEHYREIPLNVFSENLDTIVFCNVLSLAIQNGNFTGDINAEVNTFLNGSVPNQNEKEAINKLFTVRSF